jgi:hypothetical protein
MILLIKFLILILQMIVSHFSLHPPFFCQLPICTNGEPIQVGKRYATSNFGSVLVVQVTRSTIYHHFLVVDDDGEEIDYLKIDEFLHSQF